MVDTRNTADCRCNIRQTLKRTVNEGSGMPLTSGPKTQKELLLELEPVVEAEVNRHLTMAKEWFPHEYVPYSDGRTYSGVLGGEGWEPGDSKVTPESRDALLVNLLTEDNLPGYHRAIADNLGCAGPMGLSAIR